MQINSGADYKIIKGVADDEELENYRQCFKNNGTEKDIKNLKWLHQQNLTNSHTIYYAIHNSTVAAIYTAMPVFFNINRHKAIALQSIDTITDANHRGKGLFPKLATKLYDDAEANGLELVYGFPNENSAPGFFKKLQWVSFGEAPFMLKPLSFRYFINKFFKKNKLTAPNNEHHFYSLPGVKNIGKNTVIRELEDFKNDYDEIWNKVAMNIKVSVDRSAVYMNWRYVNKPTEPYSKCGIFINDELKGIIVFTIKNKHNGRIGYIMELIFDETLQQTGNLLLKYAIEIFKSQKVDAILAWCFPHSFNYDCFKKSGFYNLPVKFRPQHLFLGVRCFNQLNKNLVEDPTNWYISYSDSDTV